MPDTLTNKRRLMIYIRLHKLDEMCDRVQERYYRALYFDSIWDFNIFKNYFIHLILKTALLKNHGTETKYIHAVGVGEGKLI